MDSPVSTFVPHLYKYVTILKVLMSIEQIAEDLLDNYNNLGLEYEQLAKKYRDLLDTVETVRNKLKQQGLFMTPVDLLYPPYYEPIDFVKIDPRSQWWHSQYSQK